MNLNQLLKEVESDYDEFIKDFYTQGAKPLPEDIKPFISQKITESVKLALEATRVEEKVCENEHNENVVCSPFALEKGKENCKDAFGVHIHNQAVDLQTEKAKSFLGGV